MVPIEVREYKKVDLRGGTVIDGFPSVGLVSTIASNYILSSLGLDQVACLDSDYFPPLSMVYASKPKFPARIYAGEEQKLAVFVSEFSPMPALDRALAKTMFSWAREQNCSLIISSVGMPAEREVGEADLRVQGVGSTESSRARLDAAAIEPLEIGIIVGVPGTLLNEGRWANFDVIVLLTKAHPEIPDARAAAEIVRAIGKLLPTVKVDVEPLLEEAGRIEARLRTLRTQVKPVEAPVPPGEIYG